MHLLEAAKGAVLASGKQESFSQLPKLTMYKGVCRGQVTTDHHE